MPIETSCGGCYSASGGNWAAHQENQAIEKMVPGNLRVGPWRPPPVDILVVLFQKQPE